MDGWASEEIFLKCFLRSRIPVSSERTHPFAQGAKGWAAHSALPRGIWVLGAFRTLGELNDLWKYSVGEWARVGGSSVAAQKGSYGVLGTPAAGNTPGARDTPRVWTDAGGNFWLFGVDGYDSNG